MLCARTHAKVRLRETLRPILFATVAGLASAACTSAPAALTASASSAAGSSSLPASAPASPVTTGPTTSVTLPPAYWFNGVATVNGKLELYGTEASGTANPPCAWATIDPTTLNLGPVATAACVDTAPGRTVGFAVSYLPQSNDATVTVVRVNPVTHVETRVATVMTFGDYSDTKTVAADGGNSLWLYDVESTGGPEAIEVSATTGAVEDVVRTPQFHRPIAAADADGLWLGNSIEGSGDVPVLVHIASGSHAVTTVMPASDHIVDWLHADGHHLWVGTRIAGATDETLWEFTGGSAHSNIQVAEPGFWTTQVVGSDATGLWTLNSAPPPGGPPGPAPNVELDVVRIDAATGAREIEASLPPWDGQDAAMGPRSDQIAFFDGAFFVLEPPYRGNGYLGYTTLARVTPRH